MKKPGANPGTKTVCVVDDEKNIREWVGRCVGHASGFRLGGMYASGEEALEKIPGIRPDIVVTDQRMAGMSGLDCARQLKERLPGLKVLFMTGYPDEDILRASVHLDGASFLMKPFQEAQLQEALKVVAQGDIYLSRALEQFLPVRIIPESSPPKGLTVREYTVLKLLAQGMSYKLIAAELGVSVKTVANELASGREKLGVHNCIGAFVKLGWINVDRDLEK